MGKRAGPPDHVTLFYRQIGVTHAFTAREYEGLFVGAMELEEAFDKAFEALSCYYSEQFNDKMISYKPEITFAEFERRVHASRLIREHGIPLPAKIDYEARVPT